MTLVPMMLIEPPQLAAMSGLASETTPGRPGEPSPVPPKPPACNYDRTTPAGDEALPKRPQDRPARMSYRRKHARRRKLGNPPQRTGPATHPPRRPPRPLGQTAANPDPR